MVKRVTEWYLFDRGFVGRLLRDGLEQVAAEVVQPNLEPEAHFPNLTPLSALHSYSYFG